MPSDVIWALAGRRIDAPGAPPRFPLDRVPAVRLRLRELLVENRVTGVVCSAACGADLVALDVARELGRQRRIVLPFAPDQFRGTSVVDRPGDWGPLYDELIADAQKADDLVVLADAAAGGDEAYERANEIILEQAAALAGAAGAASAAAVIVWDGQPRGPDDITLHFMDSARRRGLHIVEVLTR